jgi:terminase small subunit-like protein
VDGSPLSLIDFFNSILKKRPFEREANRVAKGQLRTSRHQTSEPWASANVRGEKDLNMQTRNEPKRGRSPGYSTEIAETICHRLGEGESLRAICADPMMPAKATVFRWLARNEEFRRWYALAHECLAEDLMHEILEIADNSRDHIEDRRRSIKARKWVLARLAPKKYRYR